MHSGLEKGQIEVEGKVISLPVQACPTCGNEWSWGERQLRSVVL